MSEAFLVDTNAVLDDRWPDGPGALSVLTMAELLTGIHSARTPQSAADRRHRYDRLAERFAPLPVDERVLAEYRLVDRAEVAAGRKPRARRIDLLLAATARAHDLTLWTSNVGDFAPLSDLVRVRRP
ncbi:PIN domain-containing protein [Kineococcus sp. SYSU DK001]|uniref:PIN domain-containing protein n=1 Tax=Kineococcus sp. SYSU DK001 TaxID=3383122 RepID=UPI003D7F0034